MKHKIFALILALTVASWAQTATQNPPASPQTGAAPAEKAKCCDHMASSTSKDGMSCPRHKGADGKDTASCCGDKHKMSCCGKDAKSCMKDENSAASCCKEGCGKDKTASADAACCGKSCDKGCCSADKDKKEKTAHNCCGHEMHS